MEILSAAQTNRENGVELSSYCLVVPHFNHLAQLARFLPELKRLKMPCIIIDDGSDANIKIELAKLLSLLQGFYLVEHQENKGKGSYVFPGSCA